VRHVESDPRLFRNPAPSHALRDLVSVAENPSAPAKTHFSTKERATTLKIILGMAVGGYGYVPGEGRSTAISVITNDIHDIELTIDDDTVRKYLRDAVEEHWTGRRRG
jgi:hypothetical protein